MCNPIAIGAAVVQTGLQIGGQVMEHQANKRAAAANKKSSLDAFRENIRALNLRGVQESEAASQQIEQATAQSLQERGMATVGALDAGVAGNSVTAQAQVLDRGLASFRASTLTNLDRMLNQIELEKAGAATSAQSRINQMPNPSVAATALGVAGSVANGVNDLLIRRGPKAGK